MADVELYGYSRCSSCREAAALLARFGLSVATRDLFADHLSVDELRDLTARLGASPKEIMATRSRPYRELKLAQATLSDADVVDLMCRYPALIRRPLVIAGGRHEIGFNRTRLSHLIASVKDDQNGHA